MFARVFFCIFFLLLSTSPIWGQEYNEDTVQSVRSCDRPLLTRNARVSVQAEASTNEGRRIRFHILWHHIPQSLDSFSVISESKSDTTVYVTTNTLRTLRNKRSGLFRAMADHHLRERILHTTLRWDDFELIAKGAYLCPDPIDEKKHRLRTAHPSMWYSLTKNQAQKPDSIRYYGLHSLVRTSKIGSWLAAGPQLLPKNIELRESEQLWAKLFVSLTSIESAEPPKTYPEIPEAPLWKPWTLNITNLTD